MSDLEGFYDDGITEFSWKMPEYTDREHVECSKGNHEKTRRLVVQGFLQNFTHVERWYCACGRVCWIKYNGSFMKPEVGEFGGHIEWIRETQIVQQKFARSREIGGLENGF